MRKRWYVLISNPQSYIKQMKTPNSNFFFQIQNLEKSTLRWWHFIYQVLLQQTTDEALIPLRMSVSRLCSLTGGRALGCKWKDLLPCFRTDRPSDETGVEE